MIFKTILLVAITIVSILLPVYFFWYKPKFKIAAVSVNHEAKKSSRELLIKLREKAEVIKGFSKNKAYNQTVCFLVDMSIESGKNRFFIYDMKKNSVLLSGLVAHGSCDNGFKTTAEFSNKVNSGCSSLGKFKVGGVYKGNFGISYKLYGLDSTNNNAFQRSVVLHSYDCVPEQETYPFPICNSRGCAMVSPGFMNQLKVVINASKKPVFLFVFQ